MKNLEIKFNGVGEVKGLSFTQIICSEKAYIYEAKCNETNNLHYEVFKHKESQGNDCIINEISIHYDAKVRYPNSKAFGLWAWFFRNKQKALDKFNELNNI